MKIIYTKHAILKFKDLSDLGVKVSKNLISKIIRNPLDFDDISDYPKLIVSGEIDKDHIIRIVYKKDGDIITIITFYPAKKGRYIS